MPLKLSEKSVAYQPPFLRFSMCLETGRKETLLVRKLRKEKKEMMMG
jgi:hypothetical protein